MAAQNGINRHKQTEDCLKQINKVTLDDKTFIDVLGKVGKKSFYHLPYGLFPAGAIERLDNAKDDASALCIIREELRNSVDPQIINEILDMLFEKTELGKTKHAEEIEKVYHEKIEQHQCNQYCSSRGTSPHTPTHPKAAVPLAPLPTTETQETAGTLSMAGLQNSPTVQRGQHDSPQEVSTQPDNIQAIGNQDLRKQHNDDEMKEMLKDMELELSELEKELVIVKGKAKAYERHHDIVTKQLNTEWETERIKIDRHYRSLDEKVQSTQAQVQKAFNRRIDPLTEKIKELKDRMSFGNLEKLETDLGLRESKIEDSSEASTVIDSEISFLSVVEGIPYDHEKGARLVESRKQQVKEDLHRVFMDYRETTRSIGFSRSEMIRSKCLCGDDILIGTNWGNIYVFSKTLHVRPIEEIKCATGLLKHKEYIYVCEKSGGIHKLTGDGKYVDKFKAGCFGDITFGDGRFYALMYKDNACLVSSKNSHEYWKKKELERYSGGSYRDRICAKNGTLYISSHTNHCVHIYSLHDCEYRDTIGKYGTNGWWNTLTPEMMNKPRDIDVDSFGRVVVCDYGNRRVLLYDPEKEKNHRWSILKEYSKEYPVAVAVGREDMWIGLSHYALYFFKQKRTMVHYKAV